MTSWRWWFQQDSTPGQQSNGHSLTALHTAFVPNFLDNACNRFDNRTTDSNESGHEKAAARGVPGGWDELCAQKFLND